MTAIIKHLPPEWVHPQGFRPPLGFWAVFFGDEPDFIYANKRDLINELNDLDIEFEVEE